MTARRHSSGSVPVPPGAALAVARDARSWRAFLAPFLLLVLVGAGEACVSDTTGRPDAAVAGDAGLDATGDAATSGDAPPPSATKVVVVLIDGARYTETLGDPTGTYTPNLAALGAAGCAPGPILNTGPTYTIYGMSTLHTGVWRSWTEDLTTGEVYQLYPTHWEYFRKQRGQPATQAYHVLQSLSDVWLPSRHDDYGADYWPTVVSSGYSDTQVYERLEAALETDAPALAVLTLGDVDHTGHTGDWDLYTTAISTADSLVGRLWATLASLPAYAGRTVLLVTSDHGRHDDEHGGISDHGDDCPGCQQVTFVAVGPGIDPDCQATDPPRTIADLAPTVGHILGVTTDFAEGAVMEEIFLP